MYLTPEQIINWRKVLLTMGVFQYTLSDEEVCKMVQGLQARIDEELKKPWKEPINPTSTPIEAPKFTNRPRIVERKKR